MIKSLHISNYALIDSVDIDFSDGLNIITGETGAGKSIMLGALGLILGERVDMHAIADTSRKSVIEAVFKLPEADNFRQWFDENDYDWMPGEITLRREISGSRSRAFINDSPVTLDKLQWIATRLVDIHSQHQNALLSDASFQLDILDSLAHNEELLRDYGRAYKEYRVALKEYHDTRRRISRNHTDEDFLRFQLEQLDNLNLRPGEKAELEQERDRIAGMAETKSELTAVCELLSTGEVNIIDMVDAVSEHISSVAEIFDTKDNIERRLEAIMIELSDIAGTVSSVNSGIHGDTDELEAIDSRLQSINELEARHSVPTPDMLINVRMKLRAQLDELEGAEIILADLERKARKAKSKAREAAQRLSETRAVQAKLLENSLQETARPLGMVNLQVAINVEPTDLGPTGADNVEFLFAFNKNQKLIPVKGAASGGEISRLMLSLKTIIAQTIALPTIIFDEVDTGVSGDVANRMGEMMRKIAQSIQVIAITHLPQVAAKGLTHFKVYKRDDEHSTHTHISRLDDDGRISELALMLSGSTENEAARQTAINLISTEN